MPCPASNFGNRNPFETIDPYIPPGSSKVEWPVTVDLPFDIPEVVTEGQIVDAVGMWLQAHPERWHMGYRECVHEALYAVWPNS
jgi:hypothetical protein